MMIDTGSKVIFSNTLIHACDLKVKVTDLEIFNIKVFKDSYFPNHIMDLLYICYNNRYRSKGLFDNTPTHAYDFKVKVTNLEIFNAYVFKSSYFPNHMMDRVYIWYNDRYRSKVIPHPCLKVKVTHIEILNLKYV